MNHTLSVQESYLIENALSEFVRSAATANKKAQRMRQNMEYRRRLEQRTDDQKLRKEICEFEFELR